ncbi:histidine phosphatase family protein [bacterium SGD-2]|jgi:Phosphohistidine phosphatase SixA|nr:histidine phosphatase family protein [bacterium SGD-2]
MIGVGGSSDRLTIGVPDVRELLLLRHAEALNESPTGDDIGRPLSARGHDIALRLGQALAGRGWIPQQALVSSSVRTRQTWAGVSQGVGDRAPQAVFADRLYDATAGRILDLIRTISDDVSSLAVVGHNPSMHELALRLCGDDSEPEAVRRLRLPFPAAGLARFEFDGPWEHLNPYAARLTHFLHPQDIPD